MKNLRVILKKVKQRVPYIPDFSDACNILKIFLVSVLLVGIYTFSQIHSLGDYYIVFWLNLKIFMPYLVTQLLMLIFASKIIKSASPVNAILIIILLNFACVYFIHASMTRSFEDFFTEFETSAIKLAFSCGIIFFFLIYFDWREKSIHPAETLAKLSFLQAKMRPHFLFNTINAIVSLIKKDPELARKILLNLSEILRASLRDNNENYDNTIQEEIKLCKKYLEIEKMRLGDRLNVNWNIDEEVLNSLIPKLSLQPLIENSILHGIQHLEKGGVINVNIKKVDKKIHIEIDNTKPSEEKFNEKSNNIGMNNLKERLNIFFEYDVEFKASVKNNRFFVKIEFPEKIIFKN